MRKNLATGGNLSGQTFLFTGTLISSNEAPRKNWSNKTAAAYFPGKRQTKLNYLVVGEDAGSKLEKAKKIATIKIITEDDFLKLLDNRVPGRIYFLYIRIPKTVYNAPAIHA